MSQEDIIIAEIIQCKACGEKDYIDMNDVEEQIITCLSCGNDARTIQEFVDRFIGLLFL